MFSFSIFSTHIPYLILGIAYMAYFGVYSWNRLEEKLSRNDSPDQVVESVVEHSNHRSDSDAGFTGHAPAATHPGHTKAVRVSKKTVRPPSGTPLIARLCTGARYLRPPPYTLSQELP